MRLDAVSRFGRRTLKGASGPSRSSISEGDDARVTFSIEQGLAAKSPDEIREEGR
jgi:hypothetical protein